MLIKRVYNNNVVMAVNEPDGDEFVVIGRGIAFGRRAGDEIDSSSIEKVFSLENPENATRLERVIKNIPSVYLSIAEEIMEMVRRESDLNASDNLLIALTDHLSLSLERARDGIPCDNPLLMEIKQFYRREFALAQKAADIIKAELDLAISEEEMGFITLHIVNATMGQRADILVKSIKMIQEILDVVSDDFGIVYDQDSIQYERFLRHLQFFAQRVLDKESAQSEDTFLYLLGKGQFPDALACTEKIGSHIAETYGRDVTDAEKGYLVYHIMNLVHASGSSRNQSERSEE